MIPIEYFEQVDGGVATNNDWPRGRDMFMLGSMGQIRLNNPVSQITNYFPSSGLEFDGAQLVFQQEQFLAGGHGAMGPTNYWGISQVSNVLALGPIYSPTIVTNAQGIIARVDGPVTRSIVISTNGSVGIGGSALNVLTNGKVGIGTNNPTAKLQVIGNILASGTITGSSDRNVKEDFAPVNPRKVLDKVAALPVSRWSYKADPKVTHLGPMAQDFYAAFQVGMDNKHISMVDADGVALAAIKGLDQKLEETRAENAELKRELSELKQIVSTLKQKLDGDKTLRDPGLSRQSAGKTHTPTSDL